MDTALKTHEAIEGDRLDQVVFKEYDTLKVFSSVLEANPHLVHKTTLSIGDTINLPIINLKSTPKEVKTLW
jgi:phage tail protein X